MRFFIRQRNKMSKHYVEIQFHSFLTLGRMRRIWSSMRLSFWSANQIGPPVRQAK
jgi:hypothetical protein